MRTGSLLVGVILLFAAVYFFFDAKNTLDCISSTSCLLQRGLVPNGPLGDLYSGYRQNAQLETLFSFILGVVGITLLGYGAGESTPQMAYQQPPPSFQQPTQPQAPQTQRKNPTQPGGWLTIGVAIFFVGIFLWVLTGSFLFGFLFFLIGLVPIVWAIEKRISYQPSSQPAAPSAPPPASQQTPSSSPQVRGNYCKHCGFQFSTDSKFCGQCGRERK